MYMSTQEWCAVVYKLCTCLLKNGVRWCISCVHVYGVRWCISYVLIGLVIRVWSHSNVHSLFMSVGLPI